MRKILTSIYCTKIVFKLLKTSLTFHVELFAELSIICYKNNKKVWPHFKWWSYLTYLKFYLKNNNSETFLHHILFRKKNKCSYARQNLNVLELYTSGAQTIKTRESLLPTPPNSQRETSDILLTHTKRSVSTSIVLTTKECNFLSCNFF